MRATQHINPARKSPKELGEILCASGFDINSGLFHFSVMLYNLSVVVADRQRATAAAILSSFQWDENLVGQRTYDDVAPVLASMEKSWDDQQRTVIADS